MSVTRSLLGTYCSIFIILILIAGRFRARLFTTAESRKVVPRLLLLLSIAVAAVLTAATVRPDLAATWSSRLGGEKNLSGVEITYLTREAEAYELFARSHDSIAHMLFGNGYGAVYNWHFSYKRDLRGTGSDTYFTDGTFMPGHSTWTYTLFAGGLVGLCITSVMMLRPVWSTMRTFLRGTGRRLDYEGNGVALAVFGCTCANLSQTLTSNPFLDRFGGFLIGAFFGISNYLVQRQASRLSSAFGAPEEVD